MDQGFQKINISDLKLDLLNPRLPKSKQGVNESVVIEFMLLEAATLELMMAIGQNDFFAGEQLLVIPDENSPGKFIVIEGNRRLTAVKLLIQPELSTVKKESLQKVCDEAIFKPTEIPCLKFDRKEDILKYLGFRHITGIKSWRLLEKARYLFDLKESEFQNIPFTQACRDIAKMIGSTSSYIKRLLTALTLYKKVEDEGFYGIDNLNDTRFHLNYFSDALTKEEIRNHIGINLNIDEPLSEYDSENLKEITHWWFEKNNGKSRVLGDSKGLTMLNSVLKYPNAIEAFREGVTIQEAYELTDDYNELFRKEIEKSLNAIIQADNFSNKVNNFYSGLYNDLKSIRDISLKIRSYQVQQENVEDDF